MKTRGLLGCALVAAFAAFGAALVVSTRARGGERAPAGPDRGHRSRSETGRTQPEEDAVGSAVAGGLLRAAEDGDAVDSEGRQELRDLYGDYRPYFVRGDFDSDGRLDFAQAFVRREGPEPLFDVAVFFGAEGGFGAPVWVARGLLLAGGDMSVDRSVLVVSEDVEQDVSRRWRWSASEGRFVDVDAGSEDGDEAPWVEPDLRNRTTA